jgi:hypothetical protein
LYCLCALNIIFSNKLEFFETTCSTTCARKNFSQGILKGKESLYCWPPVWLVWNQLYDYWQFLFLFAKQTNPNQSNRKSTVQWYFPLKYSLLQLRFIPSQPLFCQKVLSTHPFNFQNRSVQRATNIEPKNSAQGISLMANSVGLKSRKYPTDEIIFRT